MNDSDQLIRTALERRYARLAVPACPDASWRVRETLTAPKAGVIGRPRLFAYIAAALVLLALAGFSGNASAFIAQTYMRFVPPVATKPLPPMTHAADRLTFEQAQRQLPFAIVVPSGLPDNTSFDYAEARAHASGINLLYQARIANHYYRLVFGESTAKGPPSVPVVVETRDGVTHKYSLQIRRWRHGRIFMSLIAPGLADDVSDRIARANGA